VDTGRGILWKHKLAVSVMACRTILLQRVQASLADWQTQGKVRRLWAKDSSLWTGADEGKWLGWLDVVREQFAQCDMYEQFAREVQQAGFRDVLLLGMGARVCVPRC